jgi:hypothetical protein
MSCWSRGYIQKTNGDDPDNFLVCFDSDFLAAYKIVNRFGPELAPEGTFTDDINWRYELKEGDVIDCCDQEYTWYRATILNVRTTDTGNG